MNIPGLPENGHHFRASLDQSLDVRVLLGWSPCPAGASEGSDLRLRKGCGFDLLKKLEVLRIGARPSPFDIVDAQFIQFLCDPDFVLKRESNVFRLGTVAERGVINLD